MIPCPLHLETACNIELTHSSDSDAEIREQQQILSFFDHIIVTSRYLSDADPKPGVAVAAVGSVLIALPLALTLPGLDDLQCLVFPAQLLHARLQLLDATLVGFCAAYQRLLLLLLRYKSVTPQDKNPYNYAGTTMKMALYPSIFTSFLAGHI